LATDDVACDARSNSTDVALGLLIAFENLRLARVRGIRMMAGSWETARA
jgi:hypothetical protein